MKSLVFSSAVIGLCFSPLAIAKVDIEATTGNRTLSASRDLDKEKYRGDSKEVCLFAHWAPSASIPVAVGGGVTSISDMELFFDDTDPSLKDFYVIDKGKGLVTTVEAKAWLPTFYKFTAFAKAGANFGNVATEFEYLGKPSKTNYSVQGTRINLGLAWGWPMLSLLVAADKTTETLSVKQISGFQMPNQKGNIKLESQAVSFGMMTSF